MSDAFTGEGPAPRGYGKPVKSLPKPTVPTKTVMFRIDESHDEVIDGYLVRVVTKVTWLDGSTEEAQP